MGKRTEYSLVAGLLVLLLGLSACTTGGPHMGVKPNLNEGVAEVRGKAAEPLAVPRMAKAGHDKRMEACQKAMMESLGQADTGFDQRFIMAMTTHHQQALEMAQEALRKSERPQVRQLAQEIIKAQSREIDQMARWNQAWYGATTRTALEEGL